MKFRQRQFRVSQSPSGGFFSSYNEKKRSSSPCPSWQFSPDIPTTSPNQLHHAQATNISFLSQWGIPLPQEKKKELTLVKIPETRKTKNRKLVKSTPSFCCGKKYERFEKRISKVNLKNVLEKLFSQELRFSKQSIDIFLFRWFQNGVDRIFDSFFHPFRVGTWGTWINLVESNGRRKRLVLSVIEMETFDVSFVCNVILLRNVFYEQLLLKYIEVLHVLLAKLKLTPNFRVLQAVRYLYRT